MKITSHFYVAHVTEVDSDVHEVLVGRQLVVFVQANIWSTAEQTGTHTHTHTHIHIRNPQLSNLTHLDGNRHVVQTRDVPAFSSACIVLESSPRL
jgi:hypothetical protein